MWIVDDAVKIKTYGYLILMLSLLVAGALPLFYIVGNGINPIGFAFYVTLVGTVVSIVISIAKGTHKEIPKYARDRLQIFSLVFVGAVFAIMTLVFSYAAHFITATLMTVVYRSWPLFMILISPIMLREKITRWDAAAVGVGFAGMALALLGNTPFAIPQAALPYVMLVLFAAVADAFASSVQKRYHYELSSSLVVYNLSSLIVILPFALYAHALTITNITTIALFAIVGLGVVQNVVMTYLFTTALRSVKTAVAGNSYMIVPFVTMLLDTLILREPIILGYIIIALSVVAGLLINMLAPKSASYLARTRNRVLPTMYDVTSAFINTKSTLVHDRIRGNGRVLAYYKGSGEAEDHLNVIRSKSNSEGCIILTNKAPTEHVSNAEFEFIRDVLGHERDDLVVLGVGEPDAIEKKFAELHADALV